MGAGLRRREAHHRAARPPRASRPDPHHAWRFLPDPPQNTDLTNEGLSTKNVSSDRGAGVDQHPAADLDHFPSAVDTTLSRKGRGGRNALGLCRGCRSERGRGGDAPTGETRLPSGCVAAAGPSGGVGETPPQKENPRVGGWARPALRGIPASAGAPCARSSGMGVWGRSPPQETRARPRRYGRGGRPSRCPRHCSSSPAARPALTGLAKTPTPRS